MSVDHKAAIVNAGACVTGLASFIAGAFILPDEFGNVERLTMILMAVGIYSYGHMKGQQFAESALGKDKGELEHELEMRSERLERLLGIEEEVESLRRLLDSEKTLSSGYREKCAALSARLEERDRHEATAKREREATEDERRKRTYARNWALGISPDEKLLILRLYREGSIITAPMSEDGYMQYLGDATRAIEHTAVRGHDDTFEWKLTLNEFGTYVVESATDVLLEAERYSRRE